MALISIQTPPTLSGSVYPPLDSNIATPVTDWTTLQHGTQTMCSLTRDGATVLPNFMYGFIKGQGEAISVRVNGVEDHSTTSVASLLTLTPDTIIYGYSYGPNYFDLWTDPNYTDKSSTVLYGRRGLYVHLPTFSDWDYSFPDSMLKEQGAMLFAYNGECICLHKKLNSADSGTYNYSIYRGATGQFQPRVELPLKLSLKSEVISTLPIETIVNSLSNEVKTIQNEIDDINSTLNALVPDITKLVNAESSKYYVAR